MSLSVPERLAAIERRVAAACLRVGRDPGEVTLIGASKRQSDDRLQAACRAGLRNLGENIVQEAAAHREDLSRLGLDLTWHLIGPLQSNKVRKAVEIFDCVHSIDRLKIARKVNAEAARADKTLPGFLEINLGGEASKHGFAPEDLGDALAEIAAFENLPVLGLMAIPPLADTEVEARNWFRRLRELRDRHFPQGGSLSMGMSADFELAIEEGATHIRVGSALFGPRAERAGTPT